MIQRQQLLNQKVTFLLVFLFITLWTLAAQGNSPLAIVAAARAQIGRTLHYDGRYQVISYPNGDVPMVKGVCTDVVIRALRNALKMDLQQLVHEDMKTHFDCYPRIWGLHAPDTNIDHRRVPNLVVYFQRQKWTVDITRDNADYQPGDLVICIVPPHLPHIMVVSDRKNDTGRPLVIHNIGAGVREEDRLFEFELTGHYRIDTASLAEK